MRRKQEVLEEVVRQLYGWIRQLDPDPSPVHEYVVGDERVSTYELKWAADDAVNRRRKR